MKENDSILADVFAVLLLVSVPRNLAFYGLSCLARLTGQHRSKADADLAVQERCIATGCR